MKLINKNSSHALYLVLQVPINKFEISSEFIFRNVLKSNVKKKYREIEFNEDGSIPSSYYF